MSVFFTHNNLVQELLPLSVVHTCGLWTSSTLLSRVRHFSPLDSNDFTAWTAIPTKQFISICQISNYLTEKPEKSYQGFTADHAALCLSHPTVDSGMSEKANRATW